MTNENDPMSFNAQQQLDDPALPKYRTLIEVAEVISVHRIALSGSYQADA